jgi:hypothetical protein
MTEINNTHAGFIPIKVIKKEDKKPKSQQYGINRVLACYKCGQPGGTLVKDGKGYIHQDSVLCKRNQAQSKKLEVKLEVKANPDGSLKTEIVGQAEVTEQLTENVTDNG